ncbi:NUDIX domain-containing protein [Oleiagrimonas sp. C23AA]|uniref:NUDIX hydrolase n=1 Tax=Oleiagrimonas sp. C23AA TaxID=2719047 RepID=UPI00141F2B95|nr:NUDIX domain-containing protein [Oleiagrimonas sp. C23AA]NII12316.1 NUDIX domain-containing protein [Oleiagrimonas sp. C23AA]
MTVIKATAISESATPLIHTVAAVIRDACGRVLLVQKHGSDYWIQPGGKCERGESPTQTLRRELLEELGCAPREASVRALGQFEDAAVHEPGWRVRAQVFEVVLDGEPRAAAEIAALHWVSLPPDPALPIAPLSRRHILPRLA